MASLSDNQVIVARARAQERQGQFEGGQWNNWQSQPKTTYGSKPGGNAFAGGGFNEFVRFKRSQILDEKNQKYNKRRRKIDLFEDELCCFVCTAVSIP